MARPLRCLLLGLAISLGGCAVVDRINAGEQTVPLWLVDAPPSFDVVRPGRGLPPEFARFSGIWVANGVDFVPYAANARTIIAVTYVAGDGEVLVQRAETVLWGFIWPMWRWEVVSQRARIERGVLLLDASRWLSFDDTRAPTLREHFGSGNLAPVSDREPLGLVFTRSPP